MSQAGILNAVGSSPVIPTSFQTDAGVAIPIANVLQILGSGGIATSGAGNVVTITFNAVNSWIEVTSVDNPVMLTAGNGYICKGILPVVFTLPPVAVQGAEYRIAGYSNLWQIQQNAGQQILVNLLTTTLGVGGSLTATQASDTVRLLCVTNNTDFKTIELLGNPNLV